MNLQKPKKNSHFCTTALLCLLCLLTFIFPATAQQRPVVITSPNSSIRLIIESKAGAMTYAINRNNHPVVESSNMGFTLNGVKMGGQSAIATTKLFTTNETYAYRGVHSRAVNHFKGVKIGITSPPGSYQIEARVSNDGVAFRYIVEAKDSSVIDADNTQFVIPAGSIVWSQNNVKYYEGKYGKKLIDTIKSGELIGPPLTIELPANAGFVAITEAGLTDFAGMSLFVKEARTLQASLAGTSRKYGTIETSWRVVEIGKDLNTLVNCDIISNLSQPFNPVLFPKGYETDWVKPGRSVWSWLATTRSVTLDNMKHFSDLAAQLGFEYNLVDEGWANWKDSLDGKDHWMMMKELVDYSATKGVKIWVWKAYPNRRGIAGIKEPEQRKAFFKKCQEIGIVGLKVDFFDNEAQDIIQFYQAALKDAAEYHLMMDFHGANKPTGETRTWPNEMTREAIRGMEGQPPWGNHNTILAFTRYLAGHADFTPLHFGSRMGEVSWAHHIASMVVFNSPFLCIGADPQSILDNPCKEMIQSIPPVWDETIVLPQSKIGDLVLYARRKGTIWFLAAMNGSREAKNIQVDLSFLKKGNYLLYTVIDDPGKQANALVQLRKIAAPKLLSISLNAFGGFVGRIPQ